MLPFGIQSTQVHLNYMNEENFEKFEIFINKNHKYIINFDLALKKVTNNLFSNLTKFTLEKSLKILRAFK